LVVAAEVPHVADAAAVEVGLEVVDIAPVAAPFEAAVALAAPFAPAAEFALSSSQYCEQAAGDVVSTYLHHYTLQKTLPNDIAILLTVWPSEAIFSTNLGVRSVFAASTNEHCDIQKQTVQ
jgi:hypothetical protein